MTNIFRLIKNILIYLWIIIISFQVCYGQKAANLFRHIDSDLGLSNNQINTIHQDNKGFVWFATKSGLNRYDGYNFKVFKNNPNDSKTIPDNSIIDLFEDHLGILWLFTDNDLFFYFPDTESFSYSHPIFQNHVLPSKVNISSIINQSDSILWLANSQSGLYYYDVNKDSLNRFFDKDSYEKQLTTDRITAVSIDSKKLLYVVNNMGNIDVIDTKNKIVVERINTDILSKIIDEEPHFSIFVDSDDDIWLYSDKNGGGIIYINRQENKQIHFAEGSGVYNLSNPYISGVLEDEEGKIWIGTDHGGINIIDKKSLKVSVIGATPGDATGLVSNSITTLFKSREGIIWIGSYKKGINYYSKDLYQFELYRSQPHETGKFFDNDVNCFAEDKYGNLWIGTNGDGLVYFDRNNGTFKKYKESSGRNSISSDVIVSLCYDSQDRLWIGTYQGGLDLYKNGKFYNYKHNINDIKSISDDRIWQIIEDSSNRIWIGTLGGGLELYDEPNNRFVHYKSGDYNSVTSNFILALFEDYLGNIWIGTPDGLNQLDIATQRFNYYKSEKNSLESLSSSFILSIYEDSDKQLWVGTRNGLNKFDRDENSFISYGMSDGLPDNNIIAILEDENKNLWLSTLNGISHLIKDSLTNKITFRNFDLLDGLQAMEFNEHSFIKISKGEMIFGGANGFNVFNPKNILTQRVYFDVLLTDFRVSHKSIDVNDGSHNPLLTTALHLTDEIKLKYNQNSFSIGFAALNFFHPERTRFRYMLEGFNNEWIEVDASNRVATYTNLNHGNYKFKIYASASDGFWDDSKYVTLNIIVAPPFYATPLAYAVYFVFFTVMIYLLILIIRRREEVKFKRQREIDEHKRRHEIDSIKLRLFTNISHEFKTPLTLILTPVENLLSDVDSESIRSQLLTIKRNGQRLLTLINQLLDFRKIEAVGTTLKYSEDDIITFIRNSSLNFEDLFANKSIEFEFITNTNKLIMQFDKDKMDKIISNLLSNAYKFTSENDKVTLELYYSKKKEGDSVLHIKVRDNGVGIPQEYQNKIFDRFFQVEKDNYEQLGSGIGLSITKEYVKAHGGEIKVNSILGKGTVFTISLPTEIKEDFAEKRIVAEVIDELKPTILIVEDSKELRDYMREHLKNRYIIIEAENGVEGIEKAKISRPDVIVSDIMMPKMDGIEMCKNLKNDDKTKHIPIILLTANDSRENELEALEAGAEDYITKPFNLEALNIKINNIITLREEQIEIENKKQVLNIEPKMIQVTPADERFITKITSIIEKNMSNPDFSVTMLSEIAGVSRGHLYNKIVSITGDTPTYLIRVMRIKRAAQYLEKSQLTVSEVAYKVGFNEPKYFSKYFKDEYGVLPTKYIKQQKK